MLYSLFFTALRAGKKPHIVSLLKETDFILIFIYGLQTEPFRTLIKHFQGFFQLLKLQKYKAQNH